MWVIFWILLALAVGMLATKRGRGSGTWFLIALFLSPLLGFIFLMVTEDLSKKIALKDGETKNCMYCAETIKKEAVKCKHCGADLPSIAAL